MSTGLLLIFGTLGGFVLSFTLSMLYGEWDYNRRVRKFMRK